MTTRELGMVHGACAERRGDAMAWSWRSVDLDRGRSLAPIELGFFAHGFAVDPRDATRAALFEKHGPGACVIDLRARRVVAPIATSARRQFYGHGVFVAGGARLLATETDLDRDRAGVIVVRDGDDLCVLGEFPSHGRAPHDCVLVDDGRTLVVANGGGALGEPDPPCVTWIDVDSGVLRERMDLPDPRFDAGHLAISAAGDVAVVSAPRFGTPSPTTARGGLTLRGPGQPPRCIDAPAAVVADMLGETLSVVIAGDLVAATNPAGNHLGLWRLDGTHVTSLRIPMPRGLTVTADGRELIVGFGATGKLARIDLARGRASDDPGNRDGLQAGTTGSHLFSHRC